MKKQIEKLEENFKECEICIRHPGSPYICNACRYRREERSKINDLVEAFNSLPQTESPQGETNWCHKTCTNGKDTYHNFNLRENGSCADSSCTAHLPQEKLDVELLLQELFQIGLTLGGDTHASFKGKLITRKKEILSIITKAVKKNV